MNNPTATMRTLIVYAICIPLAILAGYLVSNPLDYDSLSFLGLFLFILFTPILLKYHYEMLLMFGFGTPIILFFLPSHPLAWVVITLISLTISILERAMRNERRFVSAKVVAWPLFFILAMAVFTMEMTGGMGFHQLGSAGGGGKKYIDLYAGIAIYFALTCRVIPKEKRYLYMTMFFLAGLPQFLGDLFSILPGPLKVINLIVPPSGGAMGDSSISGNFGGGMTRLGALAGTAGTLATFMVAKWGLRGIFLGGKTWRAIAFPLMIFMTMIGGFRSNTVGWFILVAILFFFEGLHRTKLLPAFVFTLIITSIVLVPMAGRLPMNFQRSLSFLPFHWNSEAVMDAQQSSDWRHQMWADIWPKVPHYLLLGKGYLLTVADFQLMGNATFANRYVGMDASTEGLAISGDYHNGPLSVLMPFGLWGAIGMLWLMAACLWLHYRNYRYSTPELKMFNTYCLAITIWSCFAFFFVFGAFTSDVANLAKYAGFSIALNGGVLGPKATPSLMRRIKALPVMLAGARS